MPCMTAVLFFFSSRRRHTRWNCHWSSDVCSSELFAYATLAGTAAASDGKGSLQYPGVNLAGGEFGNGNQLNKDYVYPSRSEERRVGKECRSRWPPDH